MAANVWQWEGRLVPGAIACAMRASMAPRTIARHAHGASSRSTGVQIHVPLVRLANIRTNSGQPSAWIVLKILSRCKGVAAARCASVNLVMARLRSCLIFLSCDLLPRTVPTLQAIKHSTRRSGTTSHGVQMCRYVRAARQGNTVRVGEIRRMVMVIVLHAAKILTRARVLPIANAT